MNMKFLLITGFFACLQLTSWAQRQWLEGVLRSDESGKPLQGVTVNVSKSLDLIASATTDAKGFYKILLDPGNYTIGLSHKDHNHITCHNVTIWENEATVFSEHLTLRKGICGDYTLSFKETIYRPNNLTSSTHFSAKRIRNMY